MSESVHSPRYQFLIEQLRQHRLDAGLMQEEVATHLGKPQSFVSKYENGERRLDLVEFIDVAEAVGADPVRLLRAVIAQRA